MKLETAKKILDDFCSSDNFLQTLMVNSLTKGEYWIELLPHDYKVLKGGATPLEINSVVIPLPYIGVDSPVEDCREFLFLSLLELYDDWVVDIT